MLGLQQWPWYSYNLFSNVFGAVEDVTKSPGASKLARSLFQSLQQQIAKETVLFPKPDDGFLTDGSNFYKLDNVRGEFHEIHKDFSTQSHPHLNIGLHKFWFRICMWLVWTVSSKFDIWMLCNAIIIRANGLISWRLEFV